MKHFTLQELTRSATAERLSIDNTPDATQVANLTCLVEQVLDPAREAFGAPIYVNSGFRCQALNSAVGGAKRSYHLQGRAADLNTRSRASNLKLYKILSKLPHKELLWENNGVWIHVAL
ncbi:MAG: D-Ala-D-Ala carboxypeptidase family metallohydrolase [Bacteroidales bacterium]|nr:D-Ala-D-Ala carboxypeptidase family metallohydrolase [Bacteroidales bacterium]MCD8393279.1 D-Ala-D-Ala carboxypeptidase family metallohydrolase [Bacteroidales bacterium]